MPATAKTDKDTATRTYLEREQGITIEAAHVHCIAPGHSPPPRCGE
jgi:hypothetical protein